MGTSKALRSYDSYCILVEFCDQTKTCEEVSILENNVSWSSNEHDCVTLPTNETGDAQQKLSKDNASLNFMTLSCDNSSVLNT